jgi:hypothetical protein
MAEIIDSIAQSNPSATTWTDLYTIPLGKSFSGTLRVNNTGTAAATFGIALSKDGAARATSHYIAGGATGGVTINSYSQKDFSIAAGAADVIRIYASTATLAFNLFGSEVTW